MSPRLLSLAPLVLFAAACTTKKPHHDVHGCAPYASNQCQTPYPNAWFEQPGESTTTGYLIVLPDGTLPLTSQNAPITSAVMGRVDGYSPATQLLAWFPQGVDPTQLTPTDSSPIDDRIAFLSTPSAPIVLLDVAARQRVPIFAELDANANPAMNQRQALIIHPAVRLDFGKRYAVAITTALHDSAGQPLAPEGQFAAWTQGKLATTDALWEVSDRLDADAAAFAAIGIQKSALALAWDFDTASADSTTGQLTSMLSATLASSPTGPGYTIASTADNTFAEDANTARLITGTFEVPSYETGPDPSPLNIDATGQAVMGAPADWSFTAVVSQCAAAGPGPAPLIVIGPGVFDDSAHAVPGAGNVVERLCGVGIGADWLGLAASDLGILTEVLANPNSFDLITGRLEQAHLNFQVLTKLALAKLATDPVFAPAGTPTVTASSPVYYWGESNGGIQGTTYLALSTEATRGQLIVPGGVWSELMWRSGDFALMLTALQNVITDPLDLQVILAMSQSLWDKTDPIEFSPLMVGTSKAALFQESIGDPVVSNVTTRTEMRTIGAKALQQLVQPVYEVTPAPGPLTGLVYTQWSIDPMPMPAYADLPGPSSNGAHTAIVGIGPAVDQGVEFLQTGQVVDKCDAGPCVFPGG